MNRSNCSEKERSSKNVLVVYKQIFIVLISTLTATLVLVIMQVETISLYDVSLIALVGLGLCVAGGAIGFLLSYNGENNETLNWAIRYIATGLAGVSIVTAYSQGQALINSMLLSFRSPPSAESLLVLIFNSFVVGFISVFIYGKLSLSIHLCRAKVTEAIQSEKASHFGMLIRDLANDLPEASRRLHPKNRLSTRNRHSKRNSQFEDLLFQAAQHAANGETNEAIDLLESATSINPDNCRGQIVLAYLQASEGELTRAKDRYEQLKKSLPDNVPASALRMMGALARLLNDRVGERTFLSAYLRRHPYDREAKVRYASLGADTIDSGINARNPA